MSELTLEQALILLDESNQQNIAMLDRLYESLGIDDSDGEIRFKWVMIEIDELKRERNALAATVEALQGGIREIMINIGAGATMSEICEMVYIMESGFSATPQQHLRDIRAEAGRAGFIEGAQSMKLAFQYSGTYSTQSKADQYAEKVRSGDK